MLSDPVAETFGLIHRHPSGENFLAPLPGAWLYARFSSEHTSPAILTFFTTLLVIMDYVRSNKGGMKLLLQNNLYVKQKVLSSGAVCWECDQRRNKFACKAKLHVLDNQVIKQVNDHTSTTLRIHTLEDFVLVDIAEHRYLIWLFGTCTIKRLEIFEDSKQM